MQQKQQHKHWKGNNTTAGKQHHQCKQIIVPTWEGFTISHVVDIVVFSHFCEKVVMPMQK
jgi:hypothetical protein